MKFRSSVQLPRQDEMQPRAAWKQGTWAKTGISIFKTRSSRVVRISEPQCVLRPRYAPPPWSQ